MCAKNATPLDFGKVCTSHKKHVVHYSSIIVLHREILCAVRTKYYALGARNDIRTVPV